MKISLNELEPCAVSDQKIKQMKKMVHAHQAALDFYKSFYSASTDVYFNKNIEKKNFSKRREDRFI